MNLRTLTITLPLPDSRSSGHAKGNWRAAAALTKRMRERAWAEARAIWTGKPMELAKLTLTFYVPDLRRRDTLNCAHGMKSAIDGVKDAGVIVDDDWQHLLIGEPTVRVDRADPRAVLTFVEVVR